MKRILMGLLLGSLLIALWQPLFAVATGEARSAQRGVELRDSFSQMDDDEPMDPEPEPEPEPDPEYPDPEG